MKTKRFFAIFFLLLLASCAPSYIVSAPSPGPLTSEEHLMLAAIYEKDGRGRSAMDEYREALALNPNEGRAYFGIANIHLKQRRYDKAEENYLKAIELDPRKGVYYNNLGWVYMETGRLIQAQTTVTRGLTLDLQAEYIYLDTLGVIETRFGNYDGAENFLRRAVLSAPQSDLGGLAHIYTHLYELYVAWNKKEKAEETKKKLDGLRAGILPAPPID